MKSSQHTTAEPVEPTLGTIGGWAMSLYQVHQRLSPYFARPEPRQHALLYLQAVLSEIPRKNGWQIAEHARLRPYGIQRLLSRAIWDQDGCVMNCAPWFTRPCPHPHCCPSPPTTSRSSRCSSSTKAASPNAVATRPASRRSIAGCTGRVENCQVGVFLSYVTAPGHAFIDRELSLPEDWCADLPRRRAAHIPDTLSFATKPELAKHMVQRAQAADLPIRWVVADTVYGHSSDLRAFLEEQGYAYALAVPTTEVVCVQTRAGLLLGDVASIAHQDCAKRLASAQCQPGNQRRALL